MGIELVLNQTWLHPTPTFFLIHLQDPVHILGEVQNNRIAHGLPCQGGPPASGQDGNVEAVGNLDNRLDISFVARNNDTDRLDLVDGSVSGVKEARISIKPHLSLDSLLKFGGDL
jgi:hypothetical protein